MGKKEILEKIGRGSAEVLGLEVRGITDDELTMIYESLGLAIGGLLRVGEPRVSVGESVLLSDVVIILGSERALWDEMGYLKVPYKRNHRDFDMELAQRAEDMVHELWYQEKPWLIKLILLLKHGVRQIPDRQMLEISRMVSGPWLQERDGDEIFDCRLATLRIAVSAVLRDRGYNENQIESGYV